VCIDSCALADLQQIAVPLYSASAALAAEYNLHNAAFKSNCVQQISSYNIVRIYPYYIITRDLLLYIISLYTLYRHY